jgi:glycosyltransferase involved in cell wall biosynthesis
VVIPTRYSEGTSLSCLEALASGKAVIATNVGGLADLILPDFNGLLIEPDEAALYAAICRLIDDPGLRERLAANGLQTAQAFGLATWQARWEQVIRQTLPPGKVPRE